jgi:hypothetical protein
MKFSETMESHVKAMYSTIDLSTTVDQLENNKRMIDFFCETNNYNDKMPFVKANLYGALAFKAKQLEL